MANNKIDPTRVRKIACGIWCIEMTLMSLLPCTSSSSSTVGGCRSSGDAAGTARDKQSTILASESATLTDFVDMSD